MNDQIHQDLKSLHLSCMAQSWMLLHETRKLGELTLQVGMKILDGQQLLDFMELIEDRHGRKSTIIASQLPVKNWYDILAKNPTIADAILDRVVKSAYRIELNGVSMIK